MFCCQQYCIILSGLECMHEYFCLKKSNCAKDTENERNPLKDQAKGRQIGPKFNYKQQKYPGQPTCYFLWMGTERERVKKHKKMKINQLRTFWIRKLPISHWDDCFVFDQWIFNVRERHAHRRLKFVKIDQIETWWRYIMNVIRHVLAVIHIYLFFFFVRSLLLH